MQDIQEHTSDPYPFFCEEYYHEEINHPGPTEITEQQIKEQIFPTGPVYDDYESDPWESHEDEPKEKQKGKFISCPEHITNNPSLETSHPASTPLPPMLINDIQTRVSSCGAYQDVYYKFSNIFHSFYEPVSEYMEWHFLHDLEPPYILNFNPWRKFEGCDHFAITAASSASDHRQSKVASIQEVT
jgi:hypothetical protein